MVRVTVVIATAFNTQGKWELLALDVVSTGGRASWRSSWQLDGTGLAGVM